MKAIRWRTRFHCRRVPVAKWSRMSGLAKDIRTTARRIAARVVPNAPAACASLPENRASHAGDKGLRGQSRVRASSARVRRHRRVNSTENATAWELKRPWTKAAESGRRNEFEQKVTKEAKPSVLFVFFVSFC